MKNKTLAQAEQTNIDFSHRAPLSVKNRDSLGLYEDLNSALGRAAAVADLIEVACGLTETDAFCTDTLLRSAQAIRFEIKDAKAVLDAYYQDSVAEVRS